MTAFTCHMLSSEHAWKSHVWPTVFAFPGTRSSGRPCKVQRRVTNYSPRLRKWRRASPELPRCVSVTLLASMPLSVLRGALIRSYPDSGSVCSCECLWTLGPPWEYGATRCQHHTGGNFHPFGKRHRDLETRSWRFFSFFLNIILYCFFRGHFVFCWCYFLVYLLTEQLCRFIFDHLTADYISGGQRSEVKVIKRSKRMFCFVFFQLSKNSEQKVQLKWFVYWQNWMQVTMLGSPRSRSLKGQKDIFWTD